MSPNLKRAIDCVYSGFANVARPKRVDACPCCLDSKEISTLLSKDLREITPPELSGYASSVFLTVGSEEDFAYFLPRILEILVTDESWWPDPEVVGRAIGTYTWKRFTGAEQAVLAHFFDTVLEDLVSASEVDGYTLDSWLCCSSHFLPKWKEYLSLVEKTPLALTRLYEWHSEELARGAIANGFWDDSPRKSEFFVWIKGLIEAGEIQSAYGL